MRSQKWTIFICWTIFIPDALSLKVSSSSKLERACPCSSTCDLPTTSRSARKPSSVKHPKVKQAVRSSIIDHLPPCPHHQTRCCWAYDRPYNLPDQQSLYERRRRPKPSLRQELALAKLHLEALRRDLVENWQQLHLRDRPVGERQLACMEHCPGEVDFVDFGRF